MAWWQEGARAVIILAYGLALIRMAGRRIFGKWSALDTVVAVIAGSNLSRAMTGSAALGGTLFATTLIVAIHWLLAHAAARWPRLSRILEGKPIGLVHQGEANGKVLLRQAISASDLNEALRKAGIEQVDQARLITLEPSGKITVVKKA